MTNEKTMSADSGLLSEGVSFKRWIKELRKRKYWYLIAAFFLPLIIQATMHIIRGVYPFGDKSVLVLDLNGQYVYFFEAIRDVFQGESSPFYTWYRALGGEFSGIYAYYVASPFALLTVLFPKDGITEALFVMTLLKTGACGLTFGIYLHNSRPSKPLYVILFSTMYAMTSYAVVQAHNTMWIDALIYLPLILLGIENIINKGRFVLYTITLTLCFFANFYIGYMVAIFCCLYFFYYYISKHSMKPFSKFFISFYKFAVFSIVAAMIASIIILPTYYSLQFGKNSFSNPSFKFNAKFDFLEIFTQMLPASYDTVRPAGLPFIYSGVMTLMLLPLYFVSKRIKGKEKIMSAILLAFMILSFSSSTLDLIWHGMQRPNWLNYRYSFMFCFLVLVFAYEAFREVSAKTYRIVLASTGVIGVLVLVVQKLDYKWLGATADNDIEINKTLGFSVAIWMTVIFLGIYLALLWAHSKKKSTAPAIALCTVISLELLLSGTYNMFALHDDVYYSTRPSYVDFMERWSGITERVQQMDTSLYRMEKTVHRKVNDNMTLRIRGISNSTSTLNASVITLLNKLGYTSKSHWSKYVGGTPVSDSLLGIKYILSNTTSNMSPEYKIVFKEPDPTTLDTDTVKQLYAYENPYALPMLYGVDPAILEYDFSEVYSSFEVTNDIVSKMLGRDVNLFSPVDVLQTNTNAREAYADGHKKYAKLDTVTGTTYVEYTIFLEERSEVYIYFPSKYPRDTKLYVDSASRGAYLTNDTHAVYRVGFLSAGEHTIKLTLTGNDLYIRNNLDYIYTFDSDAFEAAMAELSDSAIQVTDFSDTKIEGTIHIKPGDTQVFTSIPYDEGWTVKVDGKKVPLQKTLDSLLSFEASEGEHSIEMTFIPQGFVVGAVVCGIGLIFFVCFAVSDIKKRRAAKKRIIAAVKHSGLFSEDAAGNSIDIPSETGSPDGGQDEKQETAPLDAVDEARLPNMPEEAQTVAEPAVVVEPEGERAASDAGSAAEQKPLSPSEKDMKGISGNVSENDQTKKADDDAV